MTGLNYIIALEGIYPDPNSGTLANSDPFLGQIAIVATDFAPLG
jgi:microcystin-dependent protein